MTRSTPSKKAVPPSYQGALANLRPMMDAADRTGAAGYYAVGLGVSECVTLGASQKEIAAAIGRSVPAVSKMLAAIKAYPSEPKTPEDCRAFMLIWSQGQRAAKRAAKAAPSKATAAEKAIEALRCAVNRCSRVGVPASGIVPVISAVYGRTAATAATADAA